MTALSGVRKRVSGQLTQGARSLILTTDEGDVWIVDAADIESSLIGRQVKLEGIATGSDRICADWIGGT
jgi:Protein of unknown function (DUF5818)